MGSFARQTRKRHETEIRFVTFRGRFDDGHPEKGVTYPSPPQSRVHSWRGRRAAARFAPEISALKEAVNYIVKNYAAGSADDIFRLYRDQFFERYI